MGETTIALSIITLDAILPQLKIALCLLAFIVLDIVSGLIAAFTRHDYASSIMRAGLYHKLSEIFAFFFAVVCDILLPYIGITLPLVISKGTAIYIIVMECGSIIENIGKSNPELAQHLKSLFERADLPEIEEEKNEDETSGNPGSD